MRKLSKKSTYRIQTGKAAKEVAFAYLQQLELENALSFGLPEIDDRFDIWRIPLKSKDGVSIGEIVIDAITTFVDTNKTTAKEILENRLLGRKPKASKAKKKNDVP